MYNFRGPGTYNNNDTNIKNDVRGSIAHAPAMLVVAICVCGLVLFLVVLVAIKQIDVLYGIAFLFVCGGSGLLFLLFLSSTIRHLAVTDATVVSASAERKRIGIHGVITFFRTIFPAKAPGRSGTRLNEASSPDTEQQRGRYFRLCSLRKGSERASWQRDVAWEQSVHQA